MVLYCLGNIHHFNLSLWNSTMGIKILFISIIFLLAMSAPSSEADYRGVYSFMPDIEMDLSEVLPIHFSKQSRKTLSDRRMK